MAKGGFEIDFLMLVAAIGAAILGEWAEGALLLFLGTYLCVSWLTRLALLVHAAANLAWDSSLLAAAGWGLLFDLAAGAWLSLPLLIMLMIRCWLLSPLCSSRWAISRSSSASEYNFNR